MRNPKVGGASSPLHWELGFILFGFLRVVLATFLLKCSAIVVSSSLLLSPMPCAGAGAAAVGGFFLGFRLRGAPPFGACAPTPKRSCLFASVSCFASTHRLRWCFAGAALPHSCCKVQSSVHGQPILAIVTKSSTSALQSSYWTLKACAPGS